MTRSFQLFNTCLTIFVSVRTSNYFAQIRWITKSIVMNTSLLELKLKRLKISFRKEGNKLIIGKAKTDMTTLIFLVLIPLALCIFILLFSLSIGLTFGKAYLFSILLFLFAAFNFKRIGIKKEANRNVKTFVNNTLKITENGKVKTYYANSIDRFTFSVKEIRKDIFEGRLYFIDTNNNTHQILGFDDDSEQLVQNDLIWLMDFFKAYLKMK